ncbi:hypothetical protein CLF_104061, partial [Clonorchis sinensis]
DYLTQPMSFSRAHAICIAALKLPPTQYFPIVPTALTVTASYNLEANWTSSPCNTKLMIVLVYQVNQHSFSIINVHDKDVHLVSSESFTSSTLSVPNCHATQRKHEGWATARLPKPRQGKSRDGGQPGSIPALVLPSGGMATRHRKGATAERCLRLRKTHTLCIAIEKLMGLEMKQHFYTRLLECLPDGPMSDNKGVRATAHVRTADTLGVLWLQGFVRLCRSVSVVKHLLPLSTLTQQEYIQNPDIHIVAGENLANLEDDDDIAHIVEDEDEAQVLLTKLTSHTVLRDCLTASITFDTNEYSDSRICCIFPIWYAHLPGIFERRTHIRSHHGAVYTTYKPGDSVLAKRYRNGGEEWTHGYIKRRMGDVIYEVDVQSATWVRRAGQLRPEHVALATSDNSVPLGMLLAKFELPSTRAPCSDGQTTIRIYMHTKMVDQP